MINDLYQEVILDHGRRPRNFRALEGASLRAEGYNPLCGDKIKVFVSLKDDVVQDISFQGAGCAISTASASLMTESLKGKTRAEAERLLERFHEMLTAERGAKGGASELGKLAVFSGVREYPARVKCATLAWHTLRSALTNGGENVSTE
ncbi:MAG: SUF system NifU family Fe-S cluster assembly protein [Acidobacteria bacterium]|nr:SUF system NifU family Fe-S cluster assembly protein [Acidobacteriota bacterium]